MSRDGATSHEHAADAAAFALGALSREEAQEYRRHLDGCAECRAEVAAFERIVDVLPMAAPECALPAVVRRRVLAEVRGAHGASPRLRAGRAPRAVLAVATGLLLAVVLAGAWIAASGGSAGPRVLRASVVHSPGTALLRVSDGQGTLVVRHLSPPPAGRIYEVWLAHGDPPAPATPTRSLFSVNASGAADVGVSGDLRGVSAILVTPEPAGGSLRPTAAPVIVVPTS
jgi:anti-sigma-K factor RskA